MVRYVNDEYLKVKKLFDFLVFMKLLNGREEGLRLYGLVFFIVVDIKYDNGWLRVFIILVINLWYGSSYLLESVVSLVSNSVWVYELLG